MTISERKKRFKEKLNYYKSLIDNFLSSLFQDGYIPQELISAMNYSLMAGGKRIRPILCYVWGKLLGGKESDILKFASSIELIHTYSLIHDDLPAIDNDDFRRGKPTSHKKFGEAMAILAGDGLLTEAFYLMSSCDLPKDRLLEAIYEISKAAGPRGMVGGQVLDVLYTGKNIKDGDLLKKIHSLKTGAMIKASCLCGAILAEADKSDLKNASIYGEYVGLAFQVVDDILNVIGDEKKLGKPVGKDKDLGKLTYPSIFGLDQSYKYAEELVNKAIEAIDGYRGEEAEFLRDLAWYILYRTQ